MSNQFPASHRLRAKADFQAVLVSGKKLFHPAFIVRYLPNSLPHSRIGIVIPKHQVKQAVSRNRIRRVVRESFRHHAAILLAWDIVISVRARAEEISIKTTKEGLRAQIDVFFAKLSADKA